MSQTMRNLIQHVPPPPPRRRRATEQQQPRALLVELPRSFRIFLVATCTLASACALWLMVVALDPSIDIFSSLGFCQLRGRRLRQTAQVLLMSLATTVMVRGLVFLPRVAARVEEVWSERVSWLQFYVSVLGLHFPLGLFTFASWLQWYQVLYVPWCSWAQPGAFFNQASLCCILSLCGIVLTNWHGYIIQDAALACDDFLPFVQVAFTQTTPDGSRNAPGQGSSSAAAEPARRSAQPSDAETVEMKRWLEFLALLECISAVPFDEDTFGDEDGKSYPAECVICLNVWEPDDVIRRTMCGHVYHEECLGRWLSVSKSARCAVCRRSFLDGQKRCVEIPGLPAASTANGQDQDQPLPGVAPRVTEESDNADATRAVTSSIGPLEAEVIGSTSLGADEQQHVPRTVLAPQQFEQQSRGPP